MTPIRVLLPVLLVGVPAWAQLPTEAELAQALDTTHARAAKAGLVWQADALGIEALRLRSPLVVAYAQGACRLGYSAYLPGLDFRWLFPALAPVQRAAWLAGMLHHELAHCAEQATARSITHEPALPIGSQRAAEVLGDLAFALHVADAVPEGPDLVALLAQRRGQQAANDPVHDTAVELQCFLQSRGSFKPEGDWLSQLRAWQQHCWQPRPADASQMASAGAGSAWSRPPNGLTGLPRMAPASP